jgi:predicted transcriptional regulator
MNDEIWKPIEKFEERYEISNHGRVRDIIKGRFVKDYTSESSRKVNLVISSNKKRVYSLGKLVLLTFGTNPEKRSRVIYIDGDIYNNHIDNLKWTQFKTEGERHWRKLKEAQVLEIRKLAASTKLTNKEIGNLFGMSGRNVSDIIRGVSWKHLPICNYENRGIRHGSCHHLAKLTEDKVKKIKIMLNKKEKVGVIAELFNVSQTAVSCIKEEKTWKHVK